MRYSKLFGKTVKEVSSEEISLNARLLTRGGFIRREIAGVYNFLPLGLRVIEKIKKIVREEMDGTGAQELELTSLQNKDSWVKTNRWDSFDVLFKVRTSNFKDEVSENFKEYPLGPTHEEVIVPLVAQFVSSYKDLPLYLYQIQTKFRDEARAKSGILRGREFLMKDLYSFHTSDDDFKKYYEVMKKTYKKVFERVGLDAIEVEASGGAFSEFSHEYQVITENGEDEIIYCPGGDFAQNTEIAKVAEGKMCDLGHGPLQKVKTIEVGNIFPLGTKFSDAFDLTYKDENGKEQLVEMGCYGIGISRLMGTVVEVHNDEKGIIWPESVAPFKVYLISIGKDDETEKLYQTLIDNGVEALYDDRENKNPGEKFKDCDLVGIPYRVVLSSKIEKGKVELKKRSENEVKIVTKEELMSILQ